VAKSSTYTPDPVPIKVLPVGAATHKPLEKGWVVVCTMGIVNLYPALLPPRTADINAASNPTQFMDVELLNPLKLVLKPRASLTKPVLCTFGSAVKVLKLAELLG